MDLAITAVPSTYMQIGPSHELWVTHVFGYQGCKCAKDLWFPVSLGVVAAVVVVLFQVVSYVCFFFICLVHIVSCSIVFVSLRLLSSLWSVVGACLVTVSCHPERPPPIPPTKVTWWLWALPPSADANAFTCRARLRPWRPNT